MTADPTGTGRTEPPPPPPPDAPSPGGSGPGGSGGTPFGGAAGDLTMAHVIYGLYALAVVNGLTAIVGLVIAYVKRGNPAEAVADSHYTWQIRSFWYAIVLGIFASILTIILVFIPVIGWMAIVAVWLLLFAWYVWRIAKGWIRLGDRQGMVDLESFL